MGKWMLLQAAYCITGILFFVRDLFANVAMGPAMIHAFIWPYAQWLVIKTYTLHAVDSVMKLIS